MNEGAVPPPRRGRPPKQPQQQIPTTPSASSEETILGLPLEYLQNASAMTPTVNECRRSSRKKVCKYDVRDLLNKKGKKIHIEAHFDSNASSASTTWPRPAKAIPVALEPARDDVVPQTQTTSTASVTPATDLETKRKVFLEKSEIFRRFSTDQQSRPIKKVPPIPQLSPHQNEHPIRILPTASTSGFWPGNISITNLECPSETNDSQVEATTKKTMGRRKRATGNTDTKTTTPTAAPKVEQGVAAPKRRGRPPKNRSLVETSVSESCTTTDNDRLNNPKIEAIESVETDSQNISQIMMEELFMPDPLVIETLTIDDDDEVLLEEVKEEVPWQCLANDETPQADVSQQEYDDDSKMLEYQQTTVDESHSFNDIILEISSSSSREASPSCLTRNTASPNTLSYVKASKQRNFAAVSFMQESSNTDDEIATGPEFIVAAVEEIELEQTITTAPMQEISHYIEIKSGSVIEESSACLLAEESFGSAEGAEEAEPAKCATASPTAVEASSCQLIEESFESVENTEQTELTKCTTVSPTAVVASSCQLVEESFECVENAQEAESTKCATASPTVVEASSCQMVEESFESVENAEQTEPTKCVTDSPTISINSTVSYSVECGTEETNETVDVENETASRKKEEANSLIVSNDIQIFVEEVVEETAEEINTDIMPDENVVEAVESSKDSERELPAEDNVAEEKANETKETVAEEQVLTVQHTEEIPRISECNVEQIVITEVIEEPKPEPQETVCNIEEKEENEKCDTNVPPAVKKSTSPLADAKERDVNTSPSKKPITLPLKKQIEKLKQFSEQEDTAPDNPMPSNIQYGNVSVNTSTLLDILKTVQSNDADAVPGTSAVAPDVPSTSAATSTSTPVKTTQNEHLNICEDSITSTSSLDRYNSPFGKSVSKLKNKCRSSESPKSCDAKYAKSLRYAERRSGRSAGAGTGGDDDSNSGKSGVYKTLEETFAEIAAESSKVILDMASYKDKQLTEEAVTEVKENEMKTYEITVREYSPENCSDSKDTIKSYTEESSDAVVVGDAGNAKAPKSRGRKSKTKNTVETTDIERKIDFKQSLANMHSEGDQHQETEIKVPPTESVEDVKVKEEVAICKEEKLEVRQPPKKRLSRLQSLYADLDTTELLNYHAHIATENFIAEELDKRRIIKDEIKMEFDIKTEDMLSKKYRKSSSPTKSELGCSSSHEQTKRKRRHESSRKSTKSSSPSSREPRSKSKTTKASKRSSKSCSLSDKKSRKSKKHHADQVAVEEILNEAAAKKERQQRLRAAFEAALRGEEVVSEPLIREIASMNCLDQEKGGVKRQIFDESLFANPGIDVSCHPLSDIEKFINDGENLLKGTAVFKEGEEADATNAAGFLGTVAEISQAASLEELNVYRAMPEQEMMVLNEMAAAYSNMAVASYVQAQDHLISYETPADTPIATPSASPPPPSYDTIYDEFTGVRRSHRLKQISKTSKLVGRGLVRDRERFSLKDDGETRGHYTLDDQLTDLAHVEAKNAKFLKDMEERLTNFQVIKENAYICERVISREARKMICDCFLTADEEERGEYGCGEDCLNRLLMIECGPDCNVKERCTNRRFQRLLCSPCRVFRTEKKGFGIMADVQILPGEFIMEYVGEVIDGDDFERRRVKYSRDKNRHYYFMALRSDTIIDATRKGNISRFINHSCDPNAETQKWTVNGELRIGFFSRKSIMPGEEITFNYQYQRYGREAQRCYCESSNCRGWIGEEPNSDEGEQIDDDSDEDNLESREVSDSDDNDEADFSSDASVNDAEETKEEAELDVSTKKSKTKRKKKSGEDDATQKKLTKKLSKKAAKTKKQTAAAKALKKQVKMIALEDPDIEDEVLFLRDCGMKNQADTLRFSRLMVRAKLKNTRINLLEVLREAELPCRRLFLDYHGLPLLHGWMSEDGDEMAMRMRYLEILKLLPMGNKTVLTDSKVYQIVEAWRDEVDPSEISADEDEDEDDSSKPKGPTEGEKTQASDDATTAGVTSEPTQEADPRAALKLSAKLARKLMKRWDGLKEIFRIPKRERIEQMKEHEREADRQYAEQVESDDEYTDPRATHADRYERDRFGRSLSRFMKPHAIGVLGGMTSWDSAAARRRLEAAVLDESTRHLSKDERRKLFAAKVAQDENQKRLAEDHFEYDMKCRFFGLDPKTTHPHQLPFAVDPNTGEWYSLTGHPIETPPNYAHVPVKPQSTNPDDYYLPAAVAALPKEWRYAISTYGQVYYFHVKDRMPQWEPPTPDQYHGIGDSDSDYDLDLDLILNSSSDEEDKNDELVEMDDTQLKAYIDQKVKARRLRRLKHLVDSRPISPRREEDRIYNQNEVRKYKENKEKIRKRKEEIRRRKAEALSSTGTTTTPTPVTATSSALTSESSTENSTESPTTNTEAEDSDGGEIVGALPIQDYLLSSDEEDRIKEECNNSPLIEALVRGDKIVDELDALTTNRRLRRTLPPHSDLKAEDTTVVDKISKEDVGGSKGSTATEVTSSSSTSSVNITATKHELKRRKLEKREKKKAKDLETSKYRRLKEKFRCEIAGVVTQYLKPFRKDSCQIGRICSDEDFNHLAKKLTHFVMIKELRYCEAIGQTLEFSDSVKNKTREFIKKYMTKYGEVYIKPTNDPDFKDIPFKL